MRKYIYLLLCVVCACKPNLDEVAEQTIDIMPLESWADSNAKEAIITFVEEVTTEGMPDYIQPEERIAVFDNDGTLWTERPYYFQLAYALDYIRDNAADHPEWSESENVSHIINGDMESFMKGGEHALLEAVMLSHAGMTADEYRQSVKDWLETARHPKTNRPYNQMIFKPMLELLDYLRENGFKTFIVSGGGIDFMRVWVEEAYGIPPYQVVGSSIKAKYDSLNGELEIIKLPEINFIDDKAGKPVGIHQHIGMIPVMAFGNSDGDYEMLQYTTLAPGRRMGVLIHHTDSVREYAYDRGSPIGGLERGLDNAEKNGWVIVDMATDWEEVYPSN
ncbi:MAG: HAD family hydrolase [Cyclobacteriaceae bacterium]